MLGNSIALFAIAAMFGLEAFKVTDRLPRLVLAGIAVLFAAGGAFIQPIVDGAPKAGLFLTGIFNEPSSWFLLALAMFFVVRPFWSQQGDLLTHSPIEQDTSSDATAKLKAEFAKLRETYQNVIHDYQRMSGVEGWVQPVIATHALNRIAGVS